MGELKKLLFCAESELQDTIRSTQNFGSSGCSSFGNVETGLCGVQNSKMFVWELDFREKILENDVGS